MNKQNNKSFDLEERTARFGENTVTICRKIQSDAVTNPLINQLVRSSTSVGANYCEANAASSRKDFKNKIHICKKEAQETKHWIRMLSHAAPQIRTEARLLWKECQELTLIFGKILSTLKNSQLNQN
ncbi:MAG TPA: four helix bundle protein [Candidatus Paceibacterota bacterium]